MSRRWPKKVLVPVEARTLVFLTLAMIEGPAYVTVGQRVLLTAGMRKTLLDMQYEGRQMWGAFPSYSPFFDVLDSILPNSNSAHCPPRAPTREYFHKINDSIIAEHILIAGYACKAKSSRCPEWAPLIFAGSDEHAAYSRYCLAYARILRIYLGIPYNEGRVVRPKRRSKYR